MNRPLLCCCLVGVLVQTSGCSFLAHDKRDVYHFNHPFPVSDPAFRRSMDAFGNAMVEGNGVKLLNNGDEIFPAMLKAIREAKASVNLESYIFLDDRAGKLFADALIETAHRGVEVRVLVDGTGGRAGSLFGRMRQGGVDMRVYHPVRLWTIYDIGRRTHRKILVVDGLVCFTGGAGIDQRWFGNARNPQEWRDVAVQVTGPAVAQMQAIFSEDWTYTTGEILAGDKFYPPIQPAGGVRAQAIKVSRGDSSSLAKMLYYVAIQSAEKSIFIQNAYFLPDQQVREALANAVRRGVDVRVMVPGKHSDVPIVRMASRHHYDELLQGGVKIFQYTDTMMHSKTAVVDGIFSIVGSINFDARSMLKNAEESMAFYDRDFAALLEATFAADAKHCHEVTYERWKKRGIADKMAELFSWFWTPLY
ncbi:MAG TPA: phospholipase D-like domain-containing protein [Thermoanaerobaculia bacterium]|nr:phospholipase D-like domain-containing protein [Thermoanaerobaculia bacterium]